MKERDLVENPMRILSTPEQIGNFRKSLVWTDMKRELEIWIEMARWGLEDPDADSREDLINKGRIDAVKYVLEMPRVLQGTAKNDIERSEYERDSDNG